jgi:DNA-binding transcriptional regulator GbsR (MarR family)
VVKRTQTDSKHLERRVLEVCDAAGAFIEYWGFKAIHGRVWTLLALHSAPLSQIEIAEILGVSRSLISGAMSDLMEFGLVRPANEHRNAPYIAVMDVWATISEVLRTREWMLLERARNAIEAALEEAELAESDHQWDIGRLRNLQAMTELSQALLKMLIKIRMPTSIEGFGDWLVRARTLISTFRRR